MKALWLAAAAALLLQAAPVRAETPLQAQNDRLFDQLRTVRGLTDAQLRAIRTIFAHSGFIGQGNPAIAEHPETPEQCQARLDREHVAYANPEFERICGGKYMAPLYDPRKQRPQDAKACIDQFE